MSLIHRWLRTTKEERLKTSANSLCNRRDFPNRTHHRLLKNLSSSVDAFDHVTRCGVQACQLGLQDFTGVVDHTLHSPELVTGGNTDLDDVHRSRAQVL